MRVKTDDFKKLLNKAMKGAGCNSFSPITCFCKIKETNDTVSITTTDGINFLTVSCDTATDMPRAKLDCVADLKYLSAIIMKITSEFTTIYTSDNNLIVSANGKYTMSLPLDENDRYIEYPEIRVVETTATTSYEIYADYIRDIIHTNKQAMPKGDQYADLAGYMFADECITTDSLIICANNLSVFPTKVLFSQQVMDVLATFEDCINVKNIDGDLFVFSDDETIYCAYREDDSNYPLDAIKNLLNTGFEHTVYISSDELKSALDRIKIFVSPYDANACTIAFKPGKITVKNTNGTSEEDIEVGNSVECSVRVNIDFLSAQLKTMQDSISISFGNDRCIKLKDELTDRLIALVR